MRTALFSHRVVRMAVSALFAVLFVAVQVQAAEFTPSKPITMVAPAAPGGGSDVLSRTIAQIVANEKLAPQPMVVQNIPGGGQAIALTQVAQQKGNTHMLVVANPASVAGLLVAGKGAPSIKDLTMIAQLALDEQLIIVKSDSRFKIDPGYRGRIQEEGELPVDRRLRSGGPCLQPSVRKSGRDQDAVCPLQQRRREHGGPAGRPCGHDVGESPRIHRPV